MSRGEEHPVRRLAEWLLRDYEAFLEHWRRPLARYEEVQHIPFPTQVEAQKAAALLHRERKSLDQWEAMLREAFPLTNAMIQEVWEGQIRQEVEGLDEALRQLKREWDSRDT
jgi:ribosomal protein S21